MTAPATTSGPIGGFATPDEAAPLETGLLLRPSSPTNDRTRDFGYVFLLAAVELFWLTALILVAVWLLG